MRQRRTIQTGFFQEGPIIAPDTIKQRHIFVLMDLIHEYQPTLPFLFPVQSSKSRCLWKTLAMDRTGISIQIEIVLWSAHTWCSGAALQFSLAHCGPWLTWLALSLIGSGADWLWAWLAQCAHVKGCISDSITDTTFKGDILSHQVWLAVTRRFEACDITGGRVHLLAPTAVIIRFHTLNPPCTLSPSPYNPYI